MPHVSMEADRDGDNSTMITEGLPLGPREWRHGSLRDKMPRPVGRRQRSARHALELARKAIGRQYSWPIVRCARQRPG